MEKQENGPDNLHMLPKRKKKIKTKSKTEKRSYNSIKTKYLLYEHSMGQCFLPPRNMF